MTRRELFATIIGLYTLTKTKLYSTEINEHSKLFNRQKISSDAICIIGIGGGGTNIVEDLGRMNKNYKSICINSDYRALQQKKSKHKILLGRNKKFGLGCGGKDYCGKKLVTENVYKKLDKLIHNTKQVFVIVTLGGGVGSGASPEIIEYFQKNGKEVNVLLTEPFHFEGKTRLSVAQTALKNIHRLVDNVFIIKNDAIVSSGLGIKDAFLSVSRTMHQAIKNQYRLEA